MENKRKRFFKKNRKNKKKQQHETVIHSETKSKKRKKKNIFQFINNFSIGWKYLFVFLATIVFFVGATILVYNQLSIAKHDVEDIIKQSELTNTMTELALLVEQQDSAINSYIIIGSDSYINQYLELQEQIDEIFNRVDGTFAEDEQFFLNIIIENNAHITDVFINDLQHEKNEVEVTKKQIEIGSTKGRIVNLINVLSETFGESQTESINNVNKSMNNSINSLIGINALSIVLGFIILLVIGIYISNSLKKVVDATNIIASGDLTVADLTYEGKDEIGQLSTSVNLMKENIRKIITELSDASKAISTSSDILNLSAREVKEGSAQMVTTMDELATGAETQASSASDLAEKMGQFVETVQQSQQTGQAVAESSKQVLSLTSDGLELMSESVQQMNTIDQIVAEAVDKVIGLDQKSNEIFHLVEVVKGIADQTNLLALNAAIEAARAGEHGRGFAVVAEEVRKLAEEVASSVSEITGIVNSIQEETTEVVTSLNSGYEEVKNGTEQIEKTGTNFQKIEHFITAMVDNVSGIADRLGEIATNSEEMNSLITDIAAVSEEAAAGVEQTSAATQETSSAMDEISNNAVELNHLAEQLTKEVATFKL